MSEDDEVKRFYKHTNKQTEIEDNFSLARVALLDVGGLRKRAEICFRDDGLSSDLYVLDRRLFIYCGEGSFLTQSVLNNQVGYIYEVVINSTDGWAQYLSIILKGSIDPKVGEKLAKFEFAPAHSYLGKDDVVPHPCHKSVLWLDDLIGLEQMKQLLFAQK